MLISHNSPDKSARLKQERDLAISEGFIWKGVVFQTRSEDLALISGRVAKLNALVTLNEASLDDTKVTSLDGNEIPLTWRSENNTDVVFSVREYLEFAIAVDEFVESKYRDSWV